MSCSKIVFKSDEQKLRFESIYKDACSAKDSRLVMHKDALIEILMDIGEARFKYVVPLSMAVHPQNRGGAKIRIEKIFAKGAKIIQVGVSLTKCGPDSAVAFEDDPNLRTAATQMMSLCNESPSFGKYNESQIEGGSVGSGHWNQFLACIESNALVPEEWRPQLCEPGCDHLDKERLCRTQPALRKILASGLQWTFCSWRVEKCYPELPAIVQKALNVEHHIGEGSCCKYP